MDWNYVLKFLQQGNKFNIKFIGHVKSADELGSIICAMSNTKGGHIFVGMDAKNYHLKGTNIDRAWIEDIVKRYCHPKPELDVHFIQKNDKVICVIQLKSCHQKPYYYKNKCYVMDMTNQKFAVLEKEVIVDHSSGDEEQNTATDEVIDQQELQSITSELVDLTQPEPPITAEPLTDITIDLLNTSNETSPSSNSKSSDSEDVNLNERQELAIKYLEEENFIKNKTYRQLFDVSHKTAHLELVDLVDKNLISSKGSGRSTCYVLNDNKQQRLI
ncbi:hypothetical protein DID76_00370 [Candidatus Marinamargulisbacteria bacterium SCGC AG-414-C22]|nr:hypothetical protein DID76_00370 [Candidatus Marinamargulisbacteria bacterium SCGC AG-414-C22]